MTKHLDNKWLFKRYKVVIVLQLLVNYGGREAPSLV